MLALAAGKWTVPLIFFTATFFASILLLCRFVMLYGNPQVTDTDKSILVSAFVGLGAAVVIVVFVLLVAVVAILGILPEHARDYLANVLLPLIPGLLSSIGVVLTVWQSRRIELMAEVHERLARHFVPMDLHWPSLATPKEVKERIRDKTAEGIDRFHKLVRNHGGVAKKIRSRVHPDADEVVQSYILAIPSWSEGREDEIEKKAFMVAASHWLDDLLDGRNELEVYRKYTKMSHLAPDSMWNVPKAEWVFASLYRRLIIQHTDDRFYHELTKDVESSAGMDPNKPYLYLGLNRVALGSLMFSPRLSDKDRKEILRAHNRGIVSIVAQASDDHAKALMPILNDMLLDKNANIGDVLLGLTTKTAQEIAMASEMEGCNYSLSMMFSLLYAPLLYYHDIQREIECQEMVALGTFDVGYDRTVDWLSDIRTYLKGADDEDGVRIKERLEQMEMAYRCFAEKLPRFVSVLLRKIYLKRS
jgi:hypothetical protein